MSEALELFERRFPGARGAVYRAFSPYRVCPLGAHVDHQYGLISGFAIDKGVELCYQMTGDGVIELVSEDFPGTARLSVLDRSIERAGDWGDFARGCVWALGRRRRLWRGVRGVVRGSLPIGGLSSSAAVILCYLQALLQANDLLMDASELIDVALEAERDYVGVSVGKLDQSCEVYARRGHLLFLDTLDQTYELIAQPAHMPPFDIVVFYSGLSRKLGAGFNTRVDELKAASWYLKALEGLPLGTFADSRLRDVPAQVYYRRENELPEPFRRRARHFYTECERVRKGAQAFRAGDIAAFGQLVFESGLSSIQNYETGSEHLIALYEALTQADGVYGARFSGAGFKGCCVALVDPARREQCVEYVTGKYLSRFPELRGAYSVHVCKTEDGVGGALT